MTNGVDVRTAAAEFDRTAVADAESAAEDERKQVLSRFPLEEWAELPLERYALGQAAPHGPGPTYCRLMEFGTPHLGSIKGGSAAKHIMYHHKSGEWRLAAPLRGMDPQEAWAELRGQFVRAFDAVGAGDFEALEDLEVLRFGPTLVTKSLATYFPQHFLPIYAAEHLRTFVALLGGEARAGLPASRTNRQLRELVRNRAEFEGWTEQEVMRFLYKHFNPRQRTIWKIAPGERGRLWKECRDGDFICVGWDDLGDLGQYQSDTELKQALDAHWPRGSGGSLTLARRLLAFRDLEAGDRVVANRGVDEVLATGRVDTTATTPTGRSSTMSSRWSGSSPTRRNWRSPSTGGGPPSPRSTRRCSPGSQRATTPARATVPRQVGLRRARPSRCPRTYRPSSTPWSARDR
ncbi:hypothetical protein [Streptomyces sp. HB132]|uniref:hypothetical protein n=1 Tax=Streptomyces sp. HB132 TaxID=767388 RepID=UPI001DCAD417|nr:hypothetical protein [Streptomyces sp. HB132]MBM7440087.1 hypothetical protein [Streptomyces sp. HB132]